MSNFEGKIYDVTKQAVKEVYGLDVGPDTLVVEVPRNKDNGDYATGVAMKLARELHKNPVEIAEAIAAKLRQMVQTQDTKEHREAEEPPEPVPSPEEPEEKKETNPIFELFKGGIER